MPITIRPQTPVLDDTPLVERQQAAVVVAGQKATLRFIVRNADGTACDLTAYVPQADPPAYPPVRLLLAEAVAAEHRPAEIAGEIAVAAAGDVSLPLDATTMQAGIYAASLAVCDPADGSIGPVAQFYLFVEPSLFAGNAQEGLPTLQQLRLHVRDSSPAENRLLDGLAFADSEFVEAMLQTLRAWNSALPPVAPLDSIRIPIMLRAGLIEGIEATLYKFAGYWYARNKLTTSAGGMSVNDMDKGELCMAIAEKKWAAYLDWATKQKYSFNVRQGFGTSQSPYSLRGWGSGYW